jgi:tRNA dimethylallyltransferase
VALLTGVPLSEWHRRTTGGPPLAPRYLVLDPGPALQDRISHRVADMLAGGWTEETKRLAACVPPEAPAWSATGYATMRRYVRGELSRRAALERITVDTRRYAKRQRTWFRHQLPPAAVTPLDPTRPDALERATAWWMEGDGT